MPRWSSILYREFYDVPRKLVATDDSGTYLFLCRFDDVVDDYTENYEVYEMPRLSKQELLGSWFGLEQRALRRFNDVPICSISFDSSKRKVVDNDLIDKTDRQ